MAKFEIAEAQTGRFEGLYANNPNDRGQETYAGIARKFWPKWSGWKQIDHIKATHGKSAATINKFAKADPLLHKNISSFYKTNFWDVNSLDKFADQQLANSVYDFGVNAGTKKAAKFIQMAFNAVYPSEEDNILIDGQIGKKTLTAVNTADPMDLHFAFNSLRESFYRSLAKGSQAQFLASWLSRLKPYA